MKIRQLSLYLKPIRRGMISIGGGNKNAADFGAKMDGKGDQK